MKPAIFILIFVSSPEHEVLKVSYSDHPMFVVRRASVRRASSVLNNYFKRHLLKSTDPVSSKLYKIISLITFYQTALVIPLH